MDLSWDFHLLPITSCIDHTSYPKWRDQLVEYLGSIDLLPYLRGIISEPCPYTLEWHHWYSRSSYVCALIRYTTDMVFGDILPPMDWNAPPYPHTDFSILCAHYEVISSCEKDSLMHEDDLDELIVATPVAAIMLEDIATSLETLGSPHVNHLSLSAHDEDILDGVSSLFIKSHILDVVDLHEELQSLFYDPPSVAHIEYFEDSLAVSLPYFDEPPCPTTLVALEPYLAPFVLHHEFCAIILPLSSVGLSLGDPEDYIEVYLPPLATSMDIFLMKQDVGSSTLPGWLATSSLRLSSQTHFLSQVPDSMLFPHSHTFLEWEDFQCIPYTFFLPLMGD